MNVRVYVKGLGNHPMFEERMCKIHRVAQQHHKGSHRCVRLSFLPVIEWVDHVNVITNDALEQQLGSLSDEIVDNTSMEELRRFITVDNHEAV